MLTVSVGRVLVDMVELSIDFLEETRGRNNSGWRLADDAHYSLFHCSDCDRY